MKKFFNEFKTFAMRGNVLDMAIGVVIGAAFGKITTSVVNDIIMPLIGLITGGIDLTQWNILLNSAAVEAGADPVTLGIGNLLAVILDFIIVAFAMFLLVKGINKLHSLGKKDEEPAPEEPAAPTAEDLLTEIRDLLKEQQK
jgi:large conductance mechanosensitive channel protein